MREIKFRVWVGFMEYNVLVGQNGCFYKNTSTEDITKYENHTVMQYTGLLDRQGVDIYEGDIVIIFDSNFPNDEDKTAWQIKHLNGTFVMFYSKIDYYYLNANIDSFMCSFPSTWEIEVIGNIYEHPELLEETK